MSARTLHLGALLYPGFEMPDYFGPLELFSVMGRDVVTIHTVAEKAGPVAAAIGSEGPVDPRVRDADNDPFADDLNVLAKQLGMA